jgi:excisionase family DNA binding protein
MPIRALPSYQKEDGVHYMGKRKKPETHIERPFFTFAEAQEYLGISHQTVYKLMKEGLPSHKIGKKRVFLKEDLERWIKEH